MAKDKNKMQVPYFQVPNDVFDLDLKSYEKMVYIYLCRCCNNGSDAFPSYQTIADKCGISKSSAMRAVKTLEENDLLYKECRQKKDGSCNSNTYKVTYPSVTQTLPPVSDRDYHSVTETPNKELSYKEPSSIKNNNDKGIVSSETNSPQKAYSFNQYCNEYHVDNDVIENVKYYLEIYEQYQNRLHPKLKVSQWQDVTDTWFGIYDENLDKYYEVDSEEMILMIDKHFETEYRNCDYNILHFIKVKVYRMYEEAY